VIDAESFAHKWIAAWNAREGGQPGPNHETQAIALDSRSRCARRE
jgi:hypothetical protein